MKKILLILIILTFVSCSKTEIEPQIIEFTHHETDYYFLKDNPIDYYFDNVYVRHDDSMPSINEQAILYDDAWKAEMEYACDVLISNFSNDANKELFIKSQQAYLDYVDNELSIMHSLFYAMSESAEFMGYGSNFVYESQTYRADMYKLKCNKLYEYVWTIKGEVEFHFTGGTNYP